MLSDKSTLSVDKDDIPSQSDAVYETPILKECHESSHDKRRKQMHVQSISGIPEFPTYIRETLAISGGLSTELEKDDDRYAQVKKTYLPE